MMGISTGNGMYVTSDDIAHVSHDMFVYAYDISGFDGVSFERVNDDRFVPCLSPEQLGRFVHYYKLYHGGHGDDGSDDSLFDGEVVRLEGIGSFETGGGDDGEGERTRYANLVLSDASFYDAVESTYVQSDFARFTDFVSANVTDDDRSVMYNVIGRLSYVKETTRDVRSMSSLLSDMAMSNQLAVSVLVHDGDGNILMTRRPNDMIIAGGAMSTSATEAVDGDDMWEMNPVIGCASRSLSEELGLDVNVADMTFGEIVAGKNKLQPVALVDVRTDVSLHDLDISVDHDEVSDVMVVPRGGFRSVVKGHVMTEATAYHVMRTIDALG